MKKHLLILFIAGMLHDVFPLSLASADSSSRAITIRSDSWPPYNGEPSSSSPGSMIEIVKRIFVKKGYSVDYQLMPWNRSILLVEEGKFDAIVGAATECPSCYTPSEPIGMMVTHFYVRKGDPWRYNGMISLANVTVGVIADYSYTPAFNAYVEKNSADTRKVDVMYGIDPLQRNIKKLLDRRLDTIVENPLVIQCVLKEMDVRKGDIVDAGELENSVLPVFVKFSPKRPGSKKHADMFDKGISELRRSGELKKILAKYNMTDWK